MVERGRSMDGRADRQASRLAWNRTARSEWTILFSKTFNKNEERRAPSREGN